MDYYNQNLNLSIGELYIHTDEYIQKIDNFNYKSNLIDFAICQPNIDWIKNFYHSTYNSRTKNLIYINIKQPILLYKTLTYSINSKSKDYIYHIFLFENKFITSIINYSHLTSCLIYKKI